MTLRRILSATACAFPLAGCLFSDPSGSGIGSFTGNQIGCGNYIVAKANQDGKWVLVVEHPSAGISADTIYSEDLADTAGAEVRLERYNRSGLTRYCNDVWDPAVVLRETRKALSGTLKIKAYDYTPGETVLGESFRLDLELKNVRFEEGTRIDSIRIDSMSAGWLAG
jgi:hypothetical protein